MIYLFQKVSWWTSPPKERSQENQKSLGLEQQVAKTVPVAQAEQVAQVEKTQ